MDMEGEKAGVWCVIWRGEVYGLMYVIARRVYIDG